MSEKKTIRVEASQFTINDQGQVVVTHPETAKALSEAIGKNGPDNVNLDINIYCHN